MSILQRLKQETLPLHQQLEQRVDVFSCLQSLAAYRELLVAFYGFYSPLEQTLAQFEWQALGLDWAQRRKVPNLILDLQRLNVEVAKLAQCKQLPVLPDSASAIGCLYVLEGATLGGQIIQRELAAGLQITADNGAAFVNSYGAQVGSMWAAFREAVVNFATSREREDRMVRAAQDTFQKFDDWLAFSKRTHTS